LVDAFVDFEPILRCRIILIEFFDKVRTNVTVRLFDTFGNFKRFSRRNRFITFSQQSLNKCCDITPSKRNVFDTATNDITFGLTFNSTK
jgi:hypothetical protein